MLLVAVLHLQNSDFADPAAGTTRSFIKMSHASHIVTIRHNNVNFSSIFTYRDAGEV